MNHSESVDYHHHYNRSNSRLNNHQEENNYHESKLIWKPQTNQTSIQPTANTVPYQIQDLRNKERMHETTHQYLNNSQSHNTSKYIYISPENPSNPSMDGDQYNQQSTPLKSWAAVHPPIPQSRGYVQKVFEPQSQIQESESNLPTYCGPNQQQVLIPPPLPPLPSFSIARQQLTPECKVFCTQVVLNIF